MAYLLDRKYRPLRLCSQVHNSLDFGEIVGLAGDTSCGAILLRLRLTRQPYLRERLRVAIAQAREPLEARAIVLVEDARIRIRHMPLDRE
jgi:hypothetical protein